MNDIQSRKKRKNERKQCCRTAARLWRRMGSAALAAVLLYKAATVLLLAPLSHGIWALSLFLSPSKFITTDRMKQLFLSPSLLVGILLIALLNAFWNLYEFSILFHALQKGLRGEKCHIRSLCKESLLNILHALHPKGWPILLYSAVLIPFTNFFLTSTYLRKLAVPEYIMEVIRDDPLYFGLYELVFLAGLVLSILLLFLLPGFILDQKPFSKAAGESISCVRKHFLSYVWMLVRYHVRIAIRAGLIILSYGILSVAAALLIGRNSEVLLTAIGTAQQAILYPALSFVLEALSALASCSLILVLHEQANTGALPVLEMPPAHKHYPTNGKLLLFLVSLGIISATALASFGLWQLPKLGAAADFLNPFRPTITCHRGYSAEAPENTLPAFQAAIDIGADCAELDVQMTKDGVVMVSHDPSLLRCTGVNKRICDLSYDEVRALDAGSFFDSKFAGTKIPTLQEVIDLCKGKIRLNIEIKNNADTPELEAEVARLITENDILNESCVTCLSYHSLEKVKAANPAIRTGYILAFGIGNYYDLPAADFFSVETTFITTSMVSKIHLLGKTVSAWTVDRSEDVTTLQEKQVDDLITGQPDMVRETLDDNDAYNNLLLTLQEVYQVLRTEKAQAAA